MHWEKNLQAARCVQGRRGAGNEDEEGHELGNQGKGEWHEGRKLANSTHVPARPLALVRALQLPGCAHSGCGHKALRCAQRDSRLTWCTGSPAQAAGGYKAR